MEDFLGRYARRELWRLVTRLAGKGGAYVAAIGGGLWGLAIFRFSFSNVLPGGGSRLIVGPIRQFRHREVDGRFQETHRLWLVRGVAEGQQRIYALDATCTHLGCQVTWDENRRRFRCPCHGSEFSPKGKNLVGPASRPLTRFAIRLRPDDQIEVDTSVRFPGGVYAGDPPGSFVAIEEPTD
jgi:cytochrome b6-f complex iron-sulfur subunit